MQLETLRALKDWVQYGTNTASGAAGGPSSVNALIGVGPRDSGDSAPANIGTFGDETRDYWLARRTIPRESALVYPLLGVLSTEASELDGEVEQTVREGEAAITIAYCVQEAVTEDAIRDWLYSARAVQQSVRRWLGNDNIAFRTRNSVAVLSCTSMRLLPPAEPAGDLVVAGGLALRLSVRDLAP